METLVSEFRCLYGAIRTPRVTNLNYPPNAPEWVPIRTKQIFEKTYPVTSHRMPHQSKKNIKVLLKISLIYLKNFLIEIALILTVSLSSFRSGLNIARS
jgi:hypothetical protein